MDTDGINPKPTYAEMSAIAKAEAATLGNGKAPPPAPDGWPQPLSPMTEAGRAAVAALSKPTTPTQLELLQLILATLLRIEGNQTKTAMGPEPEYPRIP